MQLFDRLSNGWKLGMTSIRTIRENTNLLFFPVMSFLALFAIALTFFGGFYLLTGADPEAWLRNYTGSEWLFYLAIFGYYLVNYFIIVFFNVALVHCARLIFEEREATISDGLQHSVSRLGPIFSWALVAATVGTLLKGLQERLGSIGQLIVGLIGIVWSVATFFVVPVIAYEDVGPVEAIKRSGRIMKEKWGEAVGANFSFGLFFILGYLVILVTGFLLIYFIHPFLGIAAMILSALVLHAFVAASKTVFLAAAYNYMANQPAGYFEGDAMDHLFVPKRR